MVPYKRANPQCPDVVYSAAAPICSLLRNSEDLGGPPNTTISRSCDVLAQDAFDLHDGNRVDSQLIDHRIAFRAMHSGTCGMGS